MMKTMLAPINVHESHSKWFALKKEKDILQDKIGHEYNSWISSDNPKNEENYRKGKEDVQNLLDLNFKKVIEKLTISKDLKFYNEDGEFGAFKVDESVSLLSFNLYNYDERQKEFKDHYVTAFAIIGAKYGWSPIQDESCLILPEYKGSTTYIFKIRHYSQLMYLLDCTREELPSFVRCYKAHSLVPYTGNSILENVHPYDLLIDPCSRMFPNGLDIKIQISKRGFNSIVKSNGGKKRPESLIVDVKGEIININKNK